MPLLLSEEQLAAGEASLKQGKLTPSQIVDLVSIFRGFLNELADNYTIQATLEAADDKDGFERQQCAKLSACLVLFQENQFTPESGFAPTVSNRTGFNYSLDGEVFEIFKYCFGMFWPIPKELSNKFMSGAGRSGSSVQGRFVRTSL